jgi:mRNA interferase RelE/StbE
MQRRWEIIFHRRPERVLQKLPRDLKQEIDRAILALANGPRPLGCRKLGEYDHLLRVRDGDWRISIAVEDDRLIILMIQVLPRGRAKRF